MRFSFGGGGMDAIALHSKLHSTSDLTASLTGIASRQKWQAASTVKSVTATGMMPDCCATTPAVAPRPIGEPARGRTMFIDGTPCASASLATRCFFLDERFMRRRLEPGGESWRGATRRKTPFPTAK